MKRIFQRHNLGFAITFVFALSACDAIDDGVDVGRSTAPLTCRGCTDLYIVAHQDDDLLFMNPDIHNSITAGNTVRVVYVTSGNAGRISDGYWERRESGERAAYAAMASRPNTWSYVNQSFAGRSIPTAFLSGANVSLVFLRLPDPVTVAPDVLGLWNGTYSTVSSVDGAQTYTRAQLIDTLRAIMVSTGADRVSTLDSTATRSWDHEDHIGSALFAFAAHQQYTADHAFSIYPTYSIASDAIDLHASEQATKWSIFQIYAAYDENVPHGDCIPDGGYCDWTKRQWPISSISDGAGWIGTDDSRCLIAAGAPVAGVALSIGSCGSALRYQVSDQRIAYGSLCVQAASATPANWSTVTLASCNGGAAQKFTITSNGQIRGPNATCLAESSGSARLVDCTVSQGVMWTRQSGPASYFGQWGQFGNAEVGTQAVTAQTLRLGDYTGDGRADACIRRTDGIWCAPAQSGAYGSYARLTTEFSDALGWSIDKHGTTIQIADITGDGRADVCGRGGSGMICANSNGSSFVSPSLRTNAFANGLWDVSAAVFRSVKLGDVNGDGLADVCGRKSDGVYCALNIGSGFFGSATRWNAEEFTDARGWGTTVAGATMQLGDINGDGRADVCGRRSDGVYCALSNGASFVNPHLWSFNNQYGDASGWGLETYALSIRLADLDGDGGADLCGRGTAGLWCAISNGGTSFSQTRLWMPRDYLDSYGWTPVYHSASMAFGDIDGDGRADVCGRGDQRLICAVQ